MVQLAAQISVVLLDLLTDGSLVWCVRQSVKHGLDIWGGSSVM